MPAHLLSFSLIAHQKALGLLPQRSALEFSPLLLSGHSCLLYTISTAQGSSATWGRPYEGRNWSGENSQIQSHPSIQLHQSGDSSVNSASHTTSITSSMPCLAHWACQALALSLSFLPYFPSLRSADFLIFPNSGLTSDIFPGPQRSHDIFFDACPPRPHCPLNSTCCLS